MDPIHHQDPDKNEGCRPNRPRYFRPEALDAQQQKFYGEILLLRPLSLTLLPGVGRARAWPALVASLPALGDHGPKMAPRLTAYCVRQRASRRRLEVSRPVDRICATPVKKISPPLPRRVKALSPRQTGTVTKIVPGSRRPGGSGNS